MFTLVTDITASWPVRWNVVDAATGQVKEAELRLHFRRIGVDEYRRLFQPEDQPADAAGIEQQNRRLFNRLVAGWEDVVGADGKPLSFEDPHIATLLDFPGFAEAFGQAYTRFWLALPEEREKNSAASPAGGLATPAPSIDATPASAKA